MGHEVSVPRCYAREDNPSPLGPRTPSDRQTPSAEDRPTSFSPRCLEPKGMRARPAVGGPVRLLSSRLSRSNAREDRCRACPPSRVTPDPSTSPAMGVEEEKRRGLFSLGDLSLVQVLSGCPTDHRGDRLNALRTEQLTTAGSKKKKDEPCRPQKFAHGATCGTLALLRDGERGTFLASRCCGVQIKRIHHLVPTRWSPGRRMRPFVHRCPLIGKGAGTLLSVQVSTKPIQRVSPRPFSSFPHLGPGPVEHFFRRPPPTRG